MMPRLREHLLHVSLWETAAEVTAFGRLPDVQASWGRAASQTRTTAWLGGGAGLQCCPSVDQQHKDTNVQWLAGEVQEEDSLPDEDDSAAGRRRRRRASSGDSEEDEGGAAGGAAPRAKPLAELQPAWQWLDGIGAEDRSWLHFALYNAYETQVRQPVCPSGC